MSRVLVTTLHRTARASEAHGYLLEVDWTRQEITRRIEAPPLWGHFGERERGGRRGLRGITQYQGLIWVASCDALFGLSPETLEPERIISHPYMSHVHEIEAVEDGIWVTSTNGNGVFLINERQEVLKEGWIAGRPELDLRVHLEKNHDKYHVNTVSFQNGEVLAYSHTTGKVFRMWPGPVTELVQLEKHCHNVSMTRHGWVRNVSRDTEVKIGEVTIPLPKRGESGEFTSPGWLRGMAWLSDTRVLIGSSPASIIEVDVPERRVVRSMQLEEEVNWTVHGLYVDSVQPRPGRTAAAASMHPKHQSSRQTGFLRRVLGGKK